MITTAVWGYLIHVTSRSPRFSQASKKHPTGVVAQLPGVRPAPVGARHDGVEVDAGPLGLGLEGVHFTQVPRRYGTLVVDEHQRGGSGAVLVLSAEAPTAPRFLAPPGGPHEGVLAYSIGMPLNAFAQ